jgi:hypothetical protein
MPKTDLQQLPDDARIWLFGISPRLDAPQSSELTRRIDAFLDQWAAHGTPMTSARGIIDDQFLVIAIDKRSEASGCSIDRMYGLLKQAESDLGLSILDPERVFFRHGDGRIDVMTRDEFRENGDLHTLVFDLTAERLGQLRGSAWEKRAEESWHRDLLAQRME